ncbi:MAG: prepilin peptidase [Candidatus Woesearchaeota archaeon]
MINTDIILIITALTALIFATIVDIRIKEVPDWISFSLIATGLIIRLMHSIIFTDWPFFFYGLLGLGATFLIGNLLYHANQWGGGDAKLLMGLGATLSTKPFYLAESNIPFLATLFILILIAGAFYGVIWSISLIVKNFKKFKLEFKHLLTTRKSYVLQTTSMIASVILLVLIFFVDSTSLKLAIFILAVLLAIYFYLFAAVKSIENIHFFKKIPVENLVEGDWIAQDVKLRNKIVLTKRTTLEKKQISELKKLNIKQVLIKEGIPFVPPFLIGTIIALLIGNPFI